MWYKGCAPGSRGWLPAEDFLGGKKNCWDVMGCGRGPENGALPCIAALDRRLDGVHDGVNGGRACWMVAGSLCFESVPTGTFAQRMETCIDCRFYRMVKEEEPEFIGHWDLLLRLRTR